MGDVMLFTGVTPLDMPPDIMLEKAKGHMKQVVIVGWDNEGELFFSSSVAAGPEVLWLFELAKKRLLEICE